MRFDNIDLTGKTFGRLTVLSRAENKNGRTHWLCECTCGNRIVASTSNLQSETTRSCTCLQKETAAKVLLRHGEASWPKRSREYRIWVAMRYRCNNPNCSDHQYYGGRGITVSPRWDTFQNFLVDMGRCPPGMSLDRYPNKDGNYEPGNCRWATDEQQRHNQRPRYGGLCKRGHVLDGTTPSGSRYCSVCAKDRRQTHTAGGQGK